MPGASLKHKNEKFDSLFRRFKRSVEKADVLKEVREREHYEKPSVKRKRARAAARKRAQRIQAENDIQRKQY